MTARRTGSPESLIVDGGPDGPFVEVTPVVNREGAKKVGLIAIPVRQHGWVQLTPHEARLVANALRQAADDTEQFTFPS